MSDDRDKTYVQLPNGHKVPIKTTYVPRHGDDMLEISGLKIQKFDWPLGTSYTSQMSSSMQDTKADISQQYDVVIICALPEEREQALAAFGVSKGKRRLMQDNRGALGLQHYKFVCDGYNIALVTLGGMGMPGAVSAATRAITAMNPRLIAMTGVCAGREGKTAKGDIVIASCTYDYNAGKYTEEGFRPRPEQIPLNYPILENISNFVLQYVDIGKRIRDLWLDFYSSEPSGRCNVRPGLHLKPLATGSAVLADGGTIKEVAVLNDDLHAVDMEGYGIAAACRILARDWIVIKGIQDYGTSEKSEDERDQRQYSAFGSAVVLREILPGLLSIPNTK